jgi:hypothetical protein
MNDRLEHRMAVSLCIVRITWIQSRHRRHRKRERERRVGSHACCMMNDHRAQRRQSHLSSTWRLHNADEQGIL